MPRKKKEVEKVIPVAKKKEEPIGLMITSKSIENKQYVLEDGSVIKWEDIDKKHFLKPGHLSPPYKRKDFVIKSKDGLQFKVAK